MTIQEKFRSFLRGSLLGACPKKLGYTAFQEEKEVEQVSSGADLPSLNPRFDDGHWHEFDIKRRLIHEGVAFEAGLRRVLIVEIPISDDWIITGHYDGLIRVPETNAKWLRQGRHLFEAKSSNQGMYFKFVKNGYLIAFPSYFDQIQGYLHGKIVGFSDIDDEQSPVKGLYDAFRSLETELELSTPLTALIAVKNKETGNIWTEIIPKDDDSFFFLQRRWLEADKAVSNGVLPERLHESSENYECRACPFMKDCWGNEVVEYDSKALDTPDNQAAAKLYIVGKVLERTGKNIINGVVNSLTPSTPGKYEVMGLKINKYPTTKTSWVSEELERILTPEQLKIARVKKETFATRMDIPTITKRELYDLIQGQGIQNLLTESVNSTKEEQDNE